MILVHMWEPAVDTQLILSAGGLEMVSQSSIKASGASLVALCFLQVGLTRPLYLLLEWA